MTTTDKTLQINIRNVYGVAKAYPVDDMAKRFAQFRGATTLTLEALRQLDEMGYTIFNTCGGSVVGSIDPHALRDLSAAI